MKVIPAIDIKGGKVVRLAQGSADRETVYPLSPIDYARKWESYGVDLIHVVDLDGALEGKSGNLGIVKEIAHSVKAKIELGGGMRDEEAVKAALDAGVDRVVIGTKALNENFLEKVVRIFNGKIIVGIDAMDGIVRTKGWVFATGMKAIDLVHKVEEMGVNTVNYTDISTDGMLEGPNIGALKDIVCNCDLDVIAAGGVSGLEDLKKLKKLEPLGLKGVIIGKALYENRIELSEAIAIGIG
jgi:phosphoribosylformimino-5-aminoimidazole carboxamide ribotide isomerase